MNYETRRELYKEIETILDTKVIQYVTGTRDGAELQIADDCMDHIVEILDRIGPTKRISLILHTSGGSVDAAWEIANLMRMYCDEFQVIIPRKAMSSGTLIAIGANVIIMLKQATLGMIDPKIGHLLGPVSDFAGSPIPVSVEAFQGFFEFAEKELKIEDPELLMHLLVQYVSKLHPLVIGEVTRTRAYIRYLAEELLKYQNQDKSKRRKIIDLLCSDLGSHGFTINRRKALEFGLPVEKLSEDLYKCVNGVYQSFSSQLEFNTPYREPTPFTLKGKDTEYQITRGLIESVDSAPIEFVNKGVYRVCMIDGVDHVFNEVETEQWRRKNEPKEL